MERKPLVSVMMPVYNGGPFLRQAIDSILNQTYQNLELLIADDGSKDDTWGIISSYSSNKIKAFRFGKNIGAFPRTNFLIRQARGKYLALMDADDVSCLDRIEVQVDYLKGHPRVIVLGSQVNIIDEGGKSIGRKVVPTFWSDIYGQYSVIHPMVHPSCMINKLLIPKRKNLYRTKLGVNGDYHTFLELLQYGEFANFDRVLLNYRIHQNNSSFKSLKHYFKNTLIARWEAVTRFGYQVQPSHVFIILCQAVLVFLAPASLLTVVYTTLRNIDNPISGWLGVVAQIRARFFDPLIGGAASAKENPSAISVSGAASPAV